MLADGIAARRAGLRLYGFAPPKLATPAVELAAIVAQQTARFATMALDGLVVYDVQDEAERVATPRPFPFLPTLDPTGYATEQLARVPLPKVVYRCVHKDDAASFVDWLRRASAAGLRVAVLVGAPSRRAAGGLALADAYVLARRHAPDLVLGGIAIAERHARRYDSTSGCSRRRRRGVGFS